MIQLDKNFQFLPHPFVLINCDFTIKDATDQLLAKIGIDRERLRAMSVNELPASKKIIPVLNEDGSIQYLVYEILTPDPAGEIKNDFFSVASHELRTPITALKLQVQMARKLVESKPNELITEAKLKRFLDRANKDVLRLSQLVEDMLQVSESNQELRAEQLTWISLQDFMDDFVAKASERFYDFKNKVKIHFNAPEMVCWNLSRIEQLLTNLLSNALRYGNGAEVNLYVNSGGGNAYFEIRDKGPGIPQEDHHKIFSLFGKNSTRRSGGMGLGLYVCQEIARLHKGEINLMRSTPEGTVFEVRLPLVAN